jgi:hypothetical protein
MVMMLHEPEMKVLIALRLGVLAAAVANYCDHAEHNEALDRAWITHAGDEMRDLATQIAVETKTNLVEFYSRRLASIESANVLASTRLSNGAASALSAKTWRELQLVQVQHDRDYHPDVIGLHRFDQLRHYSLHISKLVGAFSRNALGSDNEQELLERRLPDLLLFGLKLATVMNEKLPDDPLPSRASLAERLNPATI